MKVCFITLVCVCVLVFRCVREKCVRVNAYVYV